MRVRASTLYLQNVMLKNYLKIALRSLRKQKLYAAINVVGLALGMACCLLIGLLVQYEWSFDRFHAERDRIYRVLMEEERPDGTREDHEKTPPPLGPRLDEAFPGVRHAVRLVSGQMTFVKDDGLAAEQVAMVDSTFLEVFTFPLLAGDAATALDDPNAVVLTQPVAEQRFGSAAPSEVVGRTLTLDYSGARYDFRVAGVLAPIPEASSFQFDVLMPFAQYATKPIGSNDWGARASLYVLLEAGQAPGALEAAFPPFTRVELASRIEARRGGGYLAEAGEGIRLRLQPFSRLHLEPHVPVAYEQAPHDPRYSYILGGIALLVLLIAGINFVTLSVGGSARRAREVGVRKALGAHRPQLMRQFWGETLLLSLLGLLAALLLVHAVLPTFAALTGRPLTFAALLTPLNLAVLAGLVVVLGLLAGTYPAAVLSAYRPARVLKGEVAVRGRSRFTSSLVVLQYTISVGLVVATLIMHRQLDYLVSKDLGFDEEQVVVVQTPGLTGPQQRQILTAMRGRLAPEDAVTHVVGTGYTFTRGYDTRSWNAADGSPRRAHMIGVDYGYLEALGMELAAGRDFSPDFPADSTQHVLINEAYARQYGIDEPVGHTLSGFGGFFGGDPVVIGVVEDFNFRSLHEAVEPAVLNMHPNYYVGMNAILVKVKPGGIEPTLARAEAVWREVFPERTFHYSFMDDDLAARYAGDRRWGRIVAYAAAFAILIACLGLFGLAALTVAGRTKEIGIRKVLGASVPGLVGLLSKDFARLVAVAFVLGAPVAYLSMAQWLEGFAYRTDVGPWLFVAAGAGALAVALLAVSYQAIRAALADPVDSLRYE